MAFFRDQPGLRMTDTLRRAARSLHLPTKISGTLQISVDFEQLQLL